MKIESLRSGDRFPVRVVDWDEAKAKLALMVANNPHIMGSFTEDAPIILDEIKVEFPEWSGEMRLEELMVSLSDEEAPNFEPVGIDEQGRLDEKAKVKCPECGHEFTP